MTDLKMLSKAREQFNEFALANAAFFAGKISTEKNKKLESALKAFPQGSTQYEEICCVSYNPQFQELKAIVKVKQSSGYSGKVCEGGSKEFVRFWVDYERNGKWVNEGLASFDAHDLGFKEELCYAVTKIIQPKKRSCCDSKPVLPRVRAILSWNVPPPDNDPNHVPIWGEHHEANIQIAPRNDWWCWLLNNYIPLKTKVNFTELQLDNLMNDDALEALKTPVLPKVELTIGELQKVYQKSDVSASRFAFTHLAKYVNQPSQFLDNKLSSSLTYQGLDLSAILDAILKLKFNTTYEEIKCVGLDRDASMLHAGVVIKRPGGYNGGLCKKGSLEYVAFFMDFGAGYTYMGTSAVAVHDIPSIPRDGLWYNVFQPVKLTPYQKAKCLAGKAKVKAVLSWNTPPPANPNHIAAWGDWEECNVEIKPLPFEPSDEVYPYIETLGGMAVSKIGTVGADKGYANGLSVGNTFTANDSPFVGKIILTGTILNEPDTYTSGAPRLRYRIMLKKPSNATYFPVSNSFEITATYFGTGLPFSLPISQVPDMDGYVEYHADTKAPEFVKIAQDVLGVFPTSENGLHELYLEVYDPNTGTFYTSNSVPFMVDQDKPDVGITINTGAGDCGRFKVGDKIQGTFYMSDSHALQASLSLQPASSAGGATPIFTANDGLLQYEVDLPATGTSGTWELDTTPMKPCGYTIFIHGYDRAIVNSSYVGNHNSDVKGFCLE